MPEKKGKNVFERVELRKSFKVSPKNEVKRFTNPVLNALDNSPQEIK